jgi:hypothetical protein
MYWELCKLLAFVFTPVPVGVEIHRPDPSKYLWTFQCTGFQSNYEFVRDLYRSSPYREPELRCKVA